MQPLFFDDDDKRGFVRIDINDFVYVQSVILSQIRSCFSFFLVTKGDYEKKYVRADILWS